MNDEVIYATVIIRTITLSMIYDELCQLAFGQSCEYECYAESIEELIPDIVIGQLYAKLDNVDYTEDSNYALCLLADHERNNVFRALC